MSRFTCYRHVAPLAFGHFVGEKQNRLTADNAEKLLYIKKFSQLDDGDIISQAFVATVLCQKSYISSLCFHKICGAC